jgi:hypothetical protein
MISFVGAKRSFCLSTLRARNGEKHHQKAIKSSLQIWRSSVQREMKRPSWLGGIHSVPMASFEKAHRPSAQKSRSIQ